LATFGRQLAQVVQRRSAEHQRFHRVLGEVADAQVRVRLALAGHRRELADQGLHQGRLAGAVRAEQADAVARLQAEADVVQDHCIRAIAGFDIVQRQ
jgi:phage shock protein A